MAKYEVQIEDSLVETLSALAQTRGTTIPQVIAEFASQALKQGHTNTVSDEFQRLVEEMITEDEPILRRFGR